jgi:hypothetical protein
MLSGDSKKNRDFFYKNPVRMQYDGDVVENLIKKNERTPQKEEEK